MCGIIWSGLLPWADIGLRFCRWSGGSFGIIGWLGDWYWDQSFMPMLLLDFCVLGMYYLDQEFWSQDIMMM